MSRHRALFDVDQVVQIRIGVEWFAGTVVALQHRRHLNGWAYLVRIAFDTSDELVWFAERHLVRMNP